mgnify:CR=1 FL=1
MSGKKISLTGELHIKSTGYYTTVGALEALKIVGLAFGLYDHAEEFSSLRAILQKGMRPALIVQENTNTQENPSWTTIRTLTDDPEQIQRYMAFRETLKMVQQLDRQWEKEASRLPSSHDRTTLKRDKRNANER